MNRQARSSTWTARAVERWVEAGGDADQAGDFARLGWSARDVLPVAKRSGSAAALVPPPSPPGVYRAFGLTASQAFDQSFPVLEPDTVLTVDHKAARGGRRRWHVTSDGTTATASRWSTDHTGAWACDPTVRAASLDEVLDSMPAAWRFSPQTIVEVHTTLDPIAVAGRIRFPSGSHGEPPAAWEDDAADLDHDDEAIADLLAGLEHRRLRVTSNEFRVVPVRADRRFRPVLIDVVEGRIVPRRVVAEYSWFSESGGAPVSWNGRHEVLEVAPGILALHDEGDVDPGTTVVRAGSRAEETRLVATWITERGASVEAALSLEPRAPLPPAWEEAWLQIDQQLSLALTKRQVAALRSTLEEQDETYALACRAIREPDSELGTAFGTLLVDAAETGVLGDLDGLRLP